MNRVSVCGPVSHCVSSVIVPGLKPKALHFPHVYSSEEPQNKTTHKGLILGIKKRGTEIVPIKVNLDAGVVILFHIFKLQYTMVEIIQKHGLV